MFNPHHVSYVMCQMSRVTCQLSGVRCNFFCLQSDGSIRWSVCYQWSLPRLVLLRLTFSNFSLVELHRREAVTNEDNRSILYIVSTSPYSEESTKQAILCQFQNGLAVVSLMHHLHSCFVVIFELATPKVYLAVYFSMR